MRSNTSKEPSSRRVDLIDALELVGDAEELADDLERDACAAGGGLPSAENEELGAIEAGDGGDGFGDGCCRRVRVRKSADGAIDGDQLEGNFLGDGHHDLLELGFGAEGDQPEFAAGIFGGEGGGFVERARGPWVEDGGENEFVLEAGAGWGCGWLECLQGVGGDSGADDDVEWCWH